MEIRNLTPHGVNVVAEDGTNRLIPSSGIARLAVTVERVGTHDDVPLSKSVFGEPVGLPEAKEGTLLIVSQIIKSALPGRTDLVVPAELVRDASGNIIGCRSLGV